MKRLFLLFLLAVLTIGSSNGYALIYVDADAGGANDGSSWSDAFTALQDALSAAAPGDEIWVAEGIYKPDQGASVVSGDYNVSFELTTGVAIYGGFAGDETTRDQRDWFSHRTVLSGDLNGDDEPPWGNREDNSSHVVRSSDVDDTAVLDGFIITAGHAENTIMIDDHMHRGGGMLNVSSHPTVTNCTFTNNYAFESGSGMSNDNSSPTVTNCTFSDNLGTTEGTAMYNQLSSPTVTNCTFSDNGSSLYGGVMYSVSSHPTVTNCTFTNNHADEWGGAIMNGGGSLTVTNCTFSDNGAIWWGGGGAIFNVGSSLTVTNCTFTNNHAGEWGGAIMNSGGSLTVTNCTFSDNYTNLGAV